MYGHDGGGRTVEGVAVAERARLSVDSSTLRGAIAQGKFKQR